MSYWEIHDNYPVDLVGRCFAFAMAEDQKRMLEAIQPGTTRAVKQLADLKEKVGEVFLIPQAEEVKRQETAQDIESFFNGFMGAQAAWSGAANEVAQ